MVEVRDSFASDSASRRFSTFDVGPLWPVANVSHSGRVLDSRLTVASRGPAARVLRNRSPRYSPRRITSVWTWLAAADERAAAGRLDPFTVPCAMLNTPGAPVRPGRFPGQRTVTMNG